MKSVQVLMKEISFKSQMDVWWQRTGSALAIVGGIGATYGTWFELRSIKSDNKDFKEDFKNQTMEFNKRFDTSITLGVTVPIAVSLALGFICLSFRK